MSTPSTVRKAGREKIPSQSKKKHTPSRQSKSHEFSDSQLIFSRIAVVLLFVSGIYYFLIRPNAYRWHPCKGMKAYGICLPANYSVHGFDISHFQGDIQWEKLLVQSPSEVAMRFVLVKATEGGDYVDESFRQYFHEAKIHGLIRGAYHYFSATTDPVIQAQNFIQTVQLQKGDLPPIVDVEQKGQSVQRLQNDLRTWLRLIEQHYGVVPIIYSSHKFHKKYFQHASFDRYPVWLARYYVSEPENDRWMIWQHTDSGTLPGISSQVDLNVFNGTIEELHAMTIK